jgi:hypothetical protein
MSHFTTLNTLLIDADALVKALADLGFDRLEIHVEPQPLYGHEGNLRPEKAEIIIRRAQIGPASNDIGFTRGPNGTFTAIISEYDRDAYGQDWLNRLAQRYAYHLARARLQSQGFDLVSEETGPDGRIRLTLRKLV